MPTLDATLYGGFSSNISELKKLGARRLRESFTGVGFSITDNWQIINHISKCSIPVFEGFLPAQHNENLMGLLFTMAHWHALAKLRQHTDLSLDIMDLVTIQLGTSLRKFQAETCFVFNTRELKREEAARTRQAQRAKDHRTIIYENYFYCSFPLPNTDNNCKVDWKASQDSQPQNV